MSDQRRSSSRKCVTNKHQIPTDKSGKTNNQTLPDPTVRQKNENKFLKICFFSHQLGVGNLQIQQLRTHLINEFD
jgi:hypothetical protein